MEDSMRKSRKRYAENSIMIFESGFMMGRRHEEFFREMGSDRPYMNRILNQISFDLWTALDLWEIIFEEGLQ